VPLLLAIITFALLIGITVHEFSHALAAFHLGDNTARRMGRLTLNPLAHLDPMGTLLLFIAGFGWGKPVPVNPYALRQGRVGMALVAAAGPVSNIFAAFLFALPIRAGLLAWHSPLAFNPFLGGGILGLASDVLGFIILFNLILAAFNLLPIFPLDGSKVLLGILPRDMARAFARLEAYGPVLLVLLILMDYITGAGILWRLMGPVINYLGSIAIG
jgi:Zn-dependent protease